MIFEHKSKPLLSRAAFARRLLLSTTAGLGIIALSLGAGMWGYHHFEGMGWIDAFANAAMILSGMGPLTSLATEGGKLFAGFYAIYSGLAVVIIAGVIFAPVIHRALHRFHLDAEKGK
ncbi:MAG TPA: hypothetical protein VMH34_09680 [Gammaproteobacteria bacterium]|nr:hypothetical protein [Gammaproteobacteria bacterium]